MSRVYYETVRISLTFAPLLIIVAMTAIGYYNSRKNPDYKDVIRKFYLLFTLKFLAAILAFYILYAPTLFINPILAFLVYLRAIFALEGFFYLLSYILVAAIVIMVVFVAFKAYQKSQGLYWGSIRALTRKSLYVLFAFYFLAFGVSAAAYPEAYTPFTDMLGDTIYTFSAGNIQAFKGPDIANYKKIRSLGDFTSSLSASIAKTSQNISENNDEYKAKLADAADNLKSSIADSAQELEDRIDEDIAGTFSTSGGTITGAVLMNESLTVDNTTYSKSVIPQSNSSYNLGSSSKTFSIAYIGKVSGLDAPIADSDAATKGYVDTAVAAAGSALTFVEPLYETLTQDEVGLRYATSNLKIDWGALNTIQDIALTSTPTFGGLNTNGTGTFEQIIDNGLTASEGVYTDSNKQLTSTAPSTGILGHWDRTGTELTPSNVGDALDMGTGDISSDALTLTGALSSSSNIAVATNVIPTPSGSLVSIIPVLTAAVGGIGGDYSGIAGKVLINGNNWVAGDLINGLYYFGGATIFNTAGNANLKTVGLATYGSYSFGGNTITGESIGGEFYPAFAQSGTITSENAYSIVAKDVRDEIATFNITNQYGVYVEEPTAGTNNYQVALEGNGTGSGIWFNGIVNNARIYSPAASQLRIGTDVSGTFTDIMSFEGGEVGIGITDPQHPLDVVGSINTTGSYLTNGSDYAEYFYTNDSDLKSEEVVCVDTENDNAIKRCQNDGDNNVMGIVSTNPSVVGNGNGIERENDENYKIIGMIGQVPGKVETASENAEEINIGDALTASSVAGYMRKAKAGEATVGVALQNSTKDQGTIQILISRKNKSLTVENIEEETKERIAEMDIQEQVDSLISKAQISLEENIDSKLVRLEGNISNLEDLNQILEEQMKAIKELTEANADLTNTMVSQIKNIVNAIDIDDKNNLELLGSFKAETTETGRLIINVSDEDEATIGEGVIDKGDAKVIITASVKAGDKVFVTPRVTTEGSLAVTDIDDGEFTVEVSEVIEDEDGLPFDWWVVSIEE